MTMGPFIQPSPLMTPLEMQVRMLCVVYLISIEHSPTVLKEWKALLNVSFPVVEYTTFSVSFA